MNPTTAITSPRAEERTGRGARRLRVIITHDFLETFGGAERVTVEMARVFPQAPVISFLARPSVVTRMGLEERATALLPARERLLRRYRPLAPAFAAMARIVRLAEADVVLSSSYAFAHHLRSANDAPRVCYCHSPLRFAWSMTEAYRRTWAPGGVTGPAFRALAAGMRAADRHSAQGVAAFLTQSPFTAQQIERFYGREASVIGVPIDTDLFRPSSDPPGEDYLLCARLVEPYKRVTLALEAFRGLPSRLVVAGDGPALNALRRQAPPNVTFAGHLDDEDLVNLMQHCRAAVFPSQDDFGLIPLEVQACGRPVIAFGGGGARHTVKPGHTGELFFPATANELRRALEQFDPGAYDPTEIRMHAMQWARDRFADRLLAAVLAAADRSG